jgi:hypothetical protein
MLKHELVGIDRLSTRAGEAAFLAGMIRNVCKYPFPRTIDRRELMKGVGYLQ